MNEKRNSLRLYGALFRAFFRVGILTFGGGYAMLPILQREVVEKKGWCTNEELTDYFALGQCTPGIIAVNTATFIGFKQKGVLGGIVATFSLTLPSLIIIGIIAALLQNFADYPVVQNAFAGIRAVVVALIANAVIKLLKSAVVDKATLLIFLATTVLATVLSVSPVIFVLIAALAGVILKTWKEAGRK